MRGHHRRAVMRIGPASSGSNPVDSATSDAAVKSIHSALGLGKQLRLHTSIRFWWIHGRGPEGLDPEKSDKLIFPPILSLRPDAFRAETEISARSGFKNVLYTGVCSEWGGLA